MTKELRLFNGLKSKWAFFINDNRYNAKLNVSLLLIDFTGCRFLEPFHLVILSCLIEEYFIHGVDIQFNMGSNLELNEYLHKISFFNYWNSTFDRNQFLPNRKSTCLPLWKMKSDSIDNYVVKAQQYFQTNFLSGINVAPLNISLAEIFNNIIDHSSSQVSGFTINQFYPNLNKMKIAVCDFGKGIPVVVNQFLKISGSQGLDDNAAILKAFEKSFSTKSTPQNRGFGLDTVREIAKNCNGGLKVISNSGLYAFGSLGESSLNFKKSFNGTVFEIVLDTTSFYSQESEEYNSEYEI